MVVHLNVHLYVRLHDHLNMHAFLRLTYVQLAERLGTTPEAARMRARRKGWQVIVGNDGKAAVHVSEAELEEAARTRTPERAGEQIPEQNEDVRAETYLVYRELVGELRGRIADLDEALKRERESADALRSRHEIAADRLVDREKEIHALQGRLAASAQRIGELEGELRALRRPWWRKLFGVQP